MTGIPQLEKSLRDLIACARTLIDVLSGRYVDKRQLQALAVALDAAQSVLDARAKQPRQFVVEVAGDRGPYIAEYAPLDRATLIRDLANGQWDVPTRVLECTDASREFAAAVAEHSEAEMQEPPPDVARFVQTYGHEPYREPAERDPDEWRDSWLELRRAEVAR